MRRFKILVFGVLVPLSTCAALAQEPAAPPKPGPEHQKLAYWEGKWSGKGESKPSPFGPGGPMTWTESCEWFAGGFSLVCHSDMKGPMGQVKGLGILGYNPQEKVYTYYGVDSMGMGDFAKGTVSGDAWTYTSESKMEGKTFKSRFILTRVSPTSQKMQWDLSEDGSTWKTLMVGESTKK